MLLGTEVQLVIFCTTIEAQVVFKILLVLVTGQLAITGQLGREVHLWCYDSRLKVLSQETTLVLSNTRELDRVPSTE